MRTKFNDVDVGKINRTDYFCAISCANAGVLTSDRVIQKPNFAIGHFKRAVQRCHWLNFPLENEWENLLFDRPFHKTNISFTQIFDSCKSRFWELINRLNLRWVNSDVVGHFFFLKKKKNGLIRCETECPIRLIIHRPLWNSIGFRFKTVALMWVKSWGG